MKIIEKYVSSLSRFFNLSRFPKRDFLFLDRKKNKFYYDIRHNIAKKRSVRFFYMSFLSEFFVKIVR